MLTQSDIDSLDLAHTHAQAVKKKTALETVFISLYERYKAGETLSKIEQRTLKDYLAVYRSEFASLKKKAKMKNNTDVILDKQKKVEQKLADEQEKQRIEQLKIDVVNYQKQLAELNNELVKEQENKQQLQDVISTLKNEKAKLNEVVRADNTLLFKALKKVVFYGRLHDTPTADLIATLFMFGHGHIEPEIAMKFFDTFSYTQLNNRRELVCRKTMGEYSYDLTFFPYAETFDFVGKNDRSYILPVIFKRKKIDDELTPLSKSECYISIVSAPALCVSKLLRHRLSTSKKPELYQGINYDFEDGIMVYSQEGDEQKIIKEMGLNFETKPIFLAMQYL